MKDKKKSSKLLKPRKGVLSTPNHELDRSLTFRKLLEDAGEDTSKAGMWQEFPNEEDDTTKNIKKAK